jgi:hypothetical protein
MNVVTLMPRPGALTSTLLGGAREQAVWHQDQGRHGSAATLLILIAEIEAYREAAKGQLAIVSHACATASLAQLRATVLLIASEKAAAALDEEIEQRKFGGNAEDWAALQALSDELHAAIRLAKG